MDSHEMWRGQQQIIESEEITKAIKMIYNEPVHTHSYRHTKTRTHIQIYTRKYSDSRIYTETLARTKRCRKVLGSC